LRTLATAEEQVEAADGRAFARRITPYRDNDDRIVGVVVNFTNVSAIQNARLFAERIVESVPIPFLVLDDHLRIRMANPAFYEQFDIDPKETEGRLIYDLGDRQWDIAELRRLLTSVLPHDERFSDYEMEHTFQKLGRRTMLLSGRRLDHVQMILLAIEDITERREAEAHEKMLTAELGHRVKNALNVVEAIANQTLTRSRSMEEFEDAFIGRLHAFSRSHGQLLTRDWQAGDLKEILRDAVEAHAVDPDRITVEGPAVDMSPRQAIALGLVLHELQTNAVKYGALSNEAGRVDVRWTVEDGAVHLTWREEDGPPVTRPEKEGFGSQLVRQVVSHDLNGTAEIAYNPGGLSCTIGFPVRRA
jgi:two-component system CheB/CheR fusion protein